MIPSHVANIISFGPAKEKLLVPPHSSLSSTLRLPMASSSGDFQLAACAAGFTLGFGVLTVWRAYRQTKANRSPLRSAYIYMIWGECAANLLIGILGWLFLDGTLGAT